MLKKSAFALLALAAAADALSQSGAAIRANPKYSAYLQDSQGVVVRSGSGLCWRTGYWTPTDAVTGCDGELVPPIAKPTAPEIVPPVTMRQPAPVTPAPKRCDFAVTLGNEQSFAFNRATLSAAAKKRIDNDVLDRLASCAKVDAIVVTGHTDRLGSQQYNQRLSEKRAAAVAAYLKRKGVATEIETLGAGKTRPIKSCSDKLSRAKLMECLAPNRRVVIEVRGTAKP